MKHKFYLVFGITSLFLLVLNYLLSQEGGVFDRNIIMYGSLFLATISLASYSFTVQSITHENPNKFVRGVMTGTMIKLFACIAGIGLALFLLKGKIQKQDIFYLMFVYTVYAIIEAVTLSQLNRKKQ